MTRIGRSLAVAAALLASLPSVALAHPGGHETEGLWHGFLHPIGGLDHVLAMTLVGMLAWQLGGRALVLVPAVFVASMAFGGALGAAGLALPQVEAGIAASVIALGLAIALRVRGALPILLAVVGLFGVFHGHAHGAEMPGGADGLAYGLGFVLGTSLLHAGGIGLGLLVGRSSGRRAEGVVRAAGSLAAVAGIALVLRLVV